MFSLCKRHVTIFFVLLALLLSARTKAKKNFEGASFIAYRPSTNHKCHQSSSTVPTFTALAAENKDEEEKELGIFSFIMQDDVPYGEDSRKYRRTVYGLDDWVKHRSQDKFFKCINTFGKSGIYRSLGPDIAKVTAIAAFVVLWNAVFAEGVVDFAGVQHEPLTFGGLDLPGLTLPLASFSVTGSFLGLLLAFRTNQAYNRWDEARKAWGLTINHTRNIVRNVAVWSSAEYEPDEAKRREAVIKVAGAVWSFPRSLKRHLYSPDDDEDDFREEVGKRLPAAQAEALIAATHRPNRALFDIVCAVNELPMHFIRKDDIDKSITILIDQLGACERLLSSPIPLFYTRHTARFLSSWLLLLPLGVYEPFKNSWNHIAMIPFVTAASLFLFGLEELAVQLEEPFTILNLQVYSERIGNSIVEIAGWHNDEMTKNKGYGTRQWGRNIERPEKLLTA